MAKERKATSNEQPNVPSFLASPPSRRRRRRKKVDSSAKPREEEVDAVMQTVMEAAGIASYPSDAKTNEPDPSTDDDRKPKVASNTGEEAEPTLNSKAEDEGSRNRADQESNDPSAEPTEERPHNEPQPAFDSEQEDAKPSDVESVPAKNPEPTIEEDLELLTHVERRLFSHRYASAEIETFGECIDPPKATADRAEALAVLVEEDHELLSNPKVGAMLGRLSDRSDQLDPIVAKQVKVLIRDRRELISVPASSQAKLVKLQAEAYDAWLVAKARDDWRSFAPYLDRLVSLQRKIATATNPEADPYDTLLDKYEQGTNRAFYNNFFARVKQCVIPLLSSISMSGRTLSRDCVEGRFDEARQWELARDIADLEGIDHQAHYLTSTEHPFSEAMTSNYAVTAAHVDANDLMGNVFTMLHEVGHNLYEQGVNPAFNRTSLKGGTSTGMHEAQSRFFENYVGRNRAFVPVLLALLKKRFPGQLGRVTPNMLYGAVNRVVPTLIRVEADELTYPLHILVRYEIEQLLMSGNATAREVPKLWADRYQSYIGVSVPNNTQGALQDVHWAQGSFGYFPTYALGNAYAAQLQAKMVEEGMDWDKVLSSGDLSPIRNWLRERVWQYGRSKDPKEIMEGACGEPFNPRHYANYLTHKYANLYNLR